VLDAAEVGGGTEEAAEEAAEDVAVCVSPFAGVAFDAVSFFFSVGDGAPRLSTGRSGSSSSAVETGGGAGADAAGAGGGVEAVEVGAGAVEAGAGSAVGGVGSGSGAFAFSASARLLNTGGPWTGSAGGFEGTAFFLAAAAASALADDCQVPSPIHVLFACSAVETVNNPCDTPVRKASYTVPLSSAIGTGAALYALAS
jgi:hypothetical protein